MADSDLSVTTYTGQYNGSSLLVTLVFLQILTWISVCLRTYVRAVLTKSFQFDDWLMLVAQINFTLSCAFIAVGLSYGLGRHNSVLPRWEEILALKWQAVATATYITNMMFIKLSIGVFLLRLSSQRRYTWIIWISMGIVAAMSIALFLWDMFQCDPVAAQWDTSLPGFTCVSAEQVIQAAYALSVLSIVSDWLYALLPIPMLWKAKMTPQAKATVSVVLGLGIFASIATLIRVKFLADLTDTDDILYAGTDPMVWTLIEPGVAIVASSLVTIRPLLRQLRLQGFESTERSRSGGGLWARYGRSAGHSDSGGKKLGSKRSRSASGRDAFGARDMTLKDLEAGVQAPSGRQAPAPRSFFSSRETTLVSRTSSRDREAAGPSPVRSVGAPLRAGGQEERVNTAGDGGHDDSIAPIAPWMHRGGMLPTSRGENGLVLSEQQQQQQQQQQPPPAATPTLFGRVENGKTMWRSATPNSIEEAEVIQGLRDPAARAHGRSPFS